MNKAEQSFKFDGKAIHPGCVRQFNVGLADSPPPSAHRTLGGRRGLRNEQRKLHGFQNVGQGLRFLRVRHRRRGKGLLRLQILGTTKDGMLALDTMSNEGGTMVAMTVMLIDFEAGEYSFFDDEGKKKTEKRLIMSCVGQITRGDRDSGTVTLKDGKLILGKSQYRDKDEVIELDK